MIEELDQLKDIHGRKFDVQTKQRLHETIFEEFAAYIKEVVVEKETLCKVRATKEQNKTELEKALEEKFTQFDKMLTIKQTLDFSTALSKNTRNKNEIEDCQKYLQEVTAKARDLERKLHSNATIQETKRIQSKICFYEAEITKFEENLRKVAVLEKSELIEAFDRQNKTILDMVSVWKERQDLAKRHVENREKRQLLDKQMQEAKAKVLELELAKKCDLQVITKEVKVIPLITDFQAAQGGKHLTNGQSNVFSPNPNKTIIIKSPKGTALINKVNETLPKKSLIQIDLNAFKDAKPKVCVGKQLKEKLPPQPNSKKDSLVENSRKTKSPEVAAQKTPNKMIRLNKTSPPHKATKKPPSTAPPSESAISSRIPELDEEFDAIGSTISSPGVLRSPAASEDMNGSFFGVGAAGGASDAENWF